MQQTQKLTPEEELFIRDLKAFFIRNDLKLVRGELRRYVFISNGSGSMVMDIDDVLAEIGVEEL